MNPVTQFLRSPPHFTNQLSFHRHTMDHRDATDDALMLFGHKDFASRLTVFYSPNDKLGCKPAFYKTKNRSNYFRYWTLDDFRRRNKCFLLLKATGISLSDALDFLIESQISKNDGADDDATLVNEEAPPGLSHPRQDASQQSKISSSSHNVIAACKPRGTQSTESLHDMIYDGGFSSSDTQPNLAALRYDFTMTQARDRRKFDNNQATATSRHLLDTTTRHHLFSIHHKQSSWIVRDSHTHHFVHDAESLPGITLGG
jgi:hypothetical protein